MDPEKGAIGGLPTSLRAELEPQHADLLLFACCLISGLVDSTIYRGTDKLNSRLLNCGISNIRSLQHFRFYANR
jgi:hypothetical protein